MNNEEVVMLAENFLNNRNVDYVQPGQIGRVESNRVEVIFLNPIALEPGVVIDPPDIRLWVNLNTKEVELIYLM